MNTLHILLTNFALAAGLTGASELNNGISAPTVNERRSTSDAGYFFSLREVPLSEKQYIFTADPLKRAVYIHKGQNIPLNYSMTVRSTKGFDMYFSAADYNIILSITDSKEVQGKTNMYRGYLFVRCGRKKHRYAVHGVYNR